MTVDIAQLGMEVQSASLKLATTELKEFANAAVAAEESTERVSRSGLAMNRYFSSITSALGNMRAGVGAAVASIGGGLTSALNRMKGALSGGASGLRNVAFQFNQVAQMGAVTGNYLQALLIQLPDLLGAFGLLGIALGIVAGLMAPFIMSLFSAEDASKALSEATDSAAEALDNFIASSQAAAAPIDELREKYGAFADEAQRALEAIASADQIAAMNELKGAVDLLNGSLLETVTARTALVEGTETRRLIDDYGLLKSEVYAIGQAMVALEQASTLQQSVAAASRLMNALDGARDSAGKLPPPLQAVYDNIARMVPKTAEAAAQINKLPGLLKAGQVAASAAADAVASIAGAANSAYSAVANLVGKMREMAEARAQMFKDSSLNYGKVANSGGVDAIARAGNQSSFGRDIDGTLATGAGGVFKGAGGGGGGGGGGGEVSQLEQEFEQLRELYADKAELEQEQYKASRDILREALEAKLLTQQEYAALEEALYRDHQQKMSEIDVWRYGDGLQKAGAFFGAMADSLSKGNEKMQKVSRIFAAAEALVNTYRAAAQTLADPKLPFFAKFAAVASVISTGMGLVSAIRSGSGSASVGGRGGSVSTSSPEPAAQTPQRVIIDGVSPGQSVSYETLDSLFNLLYNKNQKRGVVFQLAGASS